ncbi:MAG: CdvA-like protein [Candidatus Bathyarchaeia archaeon]
MKRQNFLELELEKAKRQRRALRDLLEAGKISQVTYDHLIGGVEKEIAEIERRRTLLADETALKMDEMKGLIEALERHLADIQVSYSAGEMEEDRFQHEKEIYTSGIKSLKMRLANLGNSLKELRRKVVEPERGFYFYEDVGKSLGQVALSLEDFVEKVKRVPLASIEFHQQRGDFAKWIRDVFTDHPLADAIEGLKEHGEELRKKIVETIKGPEKPAQAQCPECGADVSPTKTWKMVGKPSKTGEKLQLTLGYYKCPNCNKSFRQVLAKEKI